MNRNTVIARHEVITEAMLAERCPIGTLVRMVYTYEGREYVCRGKVTGYEGETFFVRTTHHDEFPEYVGGGQMWSGRSCVIIRRSRKS